MGKKSKRGNTKDDRKQQLEQRRQRQTQQQQRGDEQSIEVGDRVLYYDGAETGWMRGTVQNKGKVTDIQNFDDPNDEHPEPEKYMAKTVYKIVPHGASDEETVLLLGTGKNIVRDESLRGW